jgi:hypothetical protein
MARFVRSETTKSDRQGIDALVADDGPADGEPLKRAFARSSFAFTDVGCAAVRAIIRRCRNSRPPATASTNQSQRGRIREAFDVVRERRKCFLKSFLIMLLGRSDLSAFAAPRSAQLAQTSLA